MELSELRAALRDAATSPSAAEEDAPPAVEHALAIYAVARERKARADAEAALARRPSTLKAALKSTIALERARQHMVAELRLVGRLSEPPPPVYLRLCS